MESQAISTIVEILTDDEPLVEKWDDLYRELNLSMDIVDLKRRRNNGNLKSKPLFTEILQSLKSEKGIEKFLEILCQALERIKCIDASNKVKAAFDINKAEGLTKPIFFGFDRMSKNFTGRQEQIYEIENMLMDDFVKIIGMGGIGKTELAKQFATLHKEWNCIWLNAQNPAILQISITKFGESLGVRDGSIDLIELFCLCLEALIKLNSFKVLIIVDNVDNDYDEALAVIDVIKDQRNCSAIVTSRNTGVMGLAGDATINLKPLNITEGTALVRSSLKDECDQDILSLCKQLDYFPLALQQAVAYIKQQKAKGVHGKSFKILHYLKRFENEKKELLDFPLIKLEHKYKKTTFITWKTSIDAIKEEGVVGKISIDILHIIAYMEADNIPLQFIQKIYVLWEQSTDEEIEKAVELLIAYSLVEAKDKNISVHRLVQEVARLDLADNQVLFTLIRVLDKVDISVGFGDQRNHVLCVWRYLSQLKDDNLEKEFMSNRINLINQDFLDRIIEDNFNIESLEIASRVLGKYDKQTLIIQSRVATFAYYSDGSKYDLKDIQKLTAVFNKQADIKDQHESLVTGYSLCFTLVKCGKINEALERIQILRHRDICWNKLIFSVLKNLSNSLKLSGRSAYSVELDKHVLQSVIKQEGDHHLWANEIRDRIGPDICEF